MPDRATSPDRHAACAALADPAMREGMSAALELKLAALCYGPAAPRAPTAPTTPSGLERAIPFVLTPGILGSGVDALVNNPLADTGGTTQSETSIVAVGDVVCAAWNDAGEGFGANGFSGYGFSVDRGDTFTDGGPFPGGPDDINLGDPSLAYSVRDDTFYYAALSSLGLSMWRSKDGCQTFAYVGPISFGFDDKELMAIDNTPTSPYFGRIYVGWTDFGRFTDRNVATYSDDGGLSWATEVTMPGSGPAGQGMWPAVAPNGDVYFALVNRGSDQITDWIYKSVDGGDTWVRMTDIAANVRNPRNELSSISCGRTALNADIRNLPSPQIAISSNVSVPAGYVIHAVYPYDSDGTGPDESNVFYRRSLDGAVSWEPEVQINDDATNTDQFFPALAVSEGGIVGVSWYDRRLDPGNVLFDRYFAFSTDEGVTFTANERLSDESSPVAVTNPNFDGLSTCYHGDYDQVAFANDTFHVIWSDDRRITETGPNPDVYYDRVNISSPAGRVGASPPAVSCRATVDARVVDADLAGQEEAAVAIEATSGDVERLSLAEDIASPGTFSGSIAVGDDDDDGDDDDELEIEKGDGMIQAGDGALVTFTYEDADTGGGEPGTATAVVTLDCVGPVLENVKAEDILGNRAVVALDASERSNAEVRFGTRCTRRRLDGRATSEGVSRSPTIELTGLAPSTRYYYAVRATDALGNETFDDNNGACYEFFTQTSVALEDFELGAGDFSVESGLWRVTTDCSSSRPGHSIPTTLYFGQPGVCTFETGTATAGMVRSAPVEVETDNGATLSFNYFLERESGTFWDRATAELSVDGGPLVIVASTTGVGTPLVSNEGVWQTAVVDLSPFFKAGTGAMGAGPGTTRFEVVFRFDTIDSILNDFEGFHVDDVEILSRIPPPPPPAGDEDDDGDDNGG